MLIQNVYYNKQSNKYTQSEWGVLMKMVTIIAVAAILVGCADTNRHNGHCATSAYGVCYERWVDGAKVPSGEICRVYDGTDGHSGKTRDCGSKEWY